MSTDEIKDNNSTAANARDPQAQTTAMYEEYGRELLVFCQGQMGHHDGQEVFQTLWTKVMANLEKFDGRNARAWLYRIARNTIHDARRKKKPELNNIAAEGRVDGAASALDYFIQSEMHSTFQRCVERLDPLKQSLLRMRILGDSYKSIAESLKIEMGTVGSKFNRAKDEIRNCIEGQ